MSNYSNPIIYGSNQTERVISMEDNYDGTITIYIQEEDGSVTEKIEQNEYWILTNTQADSQSIRLEGDSYFKWVNLFKHGADFAYAKSSFKKNRNYRDYSYWVNNPKEAFMLYSGYTYYKGIQQKEVSVLAFDIETTGLEHNREAKLLLISNTFRNHKGDITRKLFSYDDYQSETEFIEAWCAWVREINPALLIGHNIFGFDLPYLDFIATRAGTALCLGRNAEFIEFDSWKSKFRKDGTQDLEYKKCKIKGRELVDTFFLSWKYDIGREYISYGLKQIIEQEGLTQKDRIFYDAGSIRHNYKKQEEWAKIKAYAITDADDALALFDLMGPSFFYMTQSIPKPFQEIMCGASGSQLNSVMIRNYLQEGHSLPKPDEVGDFTGGISIGNSGIYSNVKKLDIASLYPSLMRQYEVYDKTKDPKAYFSQLTEYFTVERLKNKKLAKETGEKHYDDLQASQKIFINSLYGFLGAPGLMFNAPRWASFVTEKGRETLIKAMQWAKNKNFILTNADTDAISFCKQDQSPFTKEEEAFLLNDINSIMLEKIRFEEDGIFSRFIVLAAKNYIMYDGKKIKTKGSALRDQKKEIKIRTFLNEIIEALVHGNTNYAEIYHKFVKECMAITSLEQIKTWSSKKTLTKAVYTSDRANETKVLDAVKGTDYREADKIWVFFKPDGSLCLAEKFDGEYDIDRLLEKLYKAAKVFKSVLPVSTLFLNYKLKRNKKFLEII